MPAIEWIVFNVFVLAMLALDLGIFHRKSHVVEVKEALIWSAVWITLALAFSGLVYYLHDHEKALQFITGYLIEKSLSVDNLFVFIMIFSYFGVAAKYQHKVLFWGIIGALLMRALFIFTGVTLINKFHAIIYLFGVFLIFTGVKMAFAGEQEVHPEKNPLIKLCNRLFPVTKNFEGDRFFIKKNQRRYATPLFIVLVVIESSDVMFALDSIPAILAVTTDPFIVYSSNVFAILGLRALYFALAGVMKMFQYLHYGLAAILAFVGIKMIISDFYEIDILVALGVIGCILLASIVVSVLLPGKDSQEKKTSGK